MNDLAHLFLARPEPLSRVGNLLGDYRRGTRVDHLPAPVLRGLANHQAVDAFTDTHPLVREGKRLFSPTRRRFAGIALDVLFDHFLIRHWHCFADINRDEWIDEIYRDLQQGRSVMPAVMRDEVQRRMAHDWLRRCDSLENVGRILDRIAARIRFRNDFAGVIRDIEPRERELEELFLAFFPQLRAHVRNRALETLMDGQIGP